MKVSEIRKACREVVGESEFVKVSLSKCGRLSIKCWSFHSMEDLQPMLKSRFGLVWYGSTSFTCAEKGYRPNPDLVGTGNDVWFHYSSWELMKEVRSDFNLKLIDAIENEKPRKLKETMKFLPTYSELVDHAKTLPLSLQWREKLKRTLRRV
jgi:hypothetical protein